MHRVEKAELTRSKRPRTPVVAFDPTPARRASPPKKAPRKPTSKSHPHIAAVSLRMRDPISEEEDCFSRWVDIEAWGREIPGIGLGPLGFDHPLEEWVCDVLMSDV